MPDVSDKTLKAVPLPARWTATVDDHVIGLAWSLDGATAAALVIGGGLSVFDRATGALHYTRAAHGAGGSAVSWHPTDGLLATSGQDGKVRIWDAVTGGPIATLDAGGEWVERVQWSADGKLLAAAAGKLVRIWNLDLKVVRDFPAHRATVTDIQWHPATAMLCSTSYGGVSMLDPLQEKPVRQFSWQGSTLVAQWSPDGRYIATGDQDSTVHFWMVKTGKDLMMSGYPNKVRELSWDHSSRYLATGGGAEVAVWDCSGKGPSNSKPIILPGHEQRVSAVAYQRRGAMLASGGDDGRVVVWQPSSKKLLRGAAQLSDPISQLAWSPDDRDLLVGGATGQVTLLHAPQGG